MTIDCTMAMKSWYKRRVQTLDWEKQHTHMGLKALVASEELGSLSCHAEWRSAGGSEMMPHFLQHPSTTVGAKNMAVNKGIVNCDPDHNG